MTYKLLNAQYEYNQSIRLGASKADMHTHTCRLHSKNRFFVFRDVSNI
jgi:hypothetical protein